MAIRDFSLKTLWNDSDGTNTNRTCVKYKGRASIKDPYSSFNGTQRLNRRNHLEGHTLETTIELVPSKIGRSHQAYFFSHIHLRVPSPFFSSDNTRPRVIYTYANYTRPTWGGLLSSAGDKQVSYRTGLHHLPCTTLNRGDLWRRKYTWSQVHAVFYSFRTHSTMVTTFFVCCPHFLEIIPPNWRTEKILRLIKVDP